MNPQEEDNIPPRPRWIGWAIGIFALCMVFGMANLAWMMLTNRLGPSQNATPGDSGVTSAQRAAIPPYPEGLSQCMSCHAVEGKRVGPGLLQVAARYQGRTDLEAYLAGKILNGSVGEWGRVLMPRQPQVTQAQAQDMARWIARLPVPAATTPAATASTPQP